MALTNKVEYNDLFKIPYKRNGRDKNGIDCYGLIKELCLRVGKDLPEYATPTEDSLAYQIIIKEVDLITRLNKPEPYCLCLFRLETNRLHIGFVLEDCNSFIHILEKRNVTVDKLDSKLWKNFLIGLYRYDK